MSNYEPPAAPPPPGGGYGGPPPAGPPGGGFGGPPPGGPPGGGYGGPPGGGFGGPPGGGYGQPQQWDVGAAVSYGWSKFQANMGQMILAALAIFAGIVVIYGIALVAIILPAGDSDYACRFNDAGEYVCSGDTGGLGFLSLIVLALLYVVFFIYAQVIGAGLIRESLAVTEGRSFSTAGVFKFQNIGNVIVTSLLVGVGTFIGTILCVIPGIIFGFMTMFSLFFVVDKNLAPVDAIKASIDLVKNNVGSTIIWYLVAYVIALVGAILCGVGLLAAIPVILLGSAFTYKKLTGQPVAP
ncbi:hypothetical protein ASE01_15570 [Nocardioides sp. Root190]|uniref:hypothetical protein n=1 Tax=Nocardioides sp. Root190 TaxID=1736488 RepID=UPI0007010A52|nr:hypothetical protein [Nocardioides sp. Root190]KRB76394.1 hypothetical protein ASE01_15570 [Nocardioides sp. Root190]